MVKGKAMSEWQYTPIENIAFALQDIANTLERIEKLMPVPEGVITTSEILSTPEPEVVEDSTTEEEDDDSTTEQG
jgi:hypothetical protein